MKKLFYLFLLLPFSLFVSCDDDKDFSPVDMTITLSGVTQSNDNFYTVAGNDVTIENLDVKAVDGTSTAVTNVMFYLDGAPIFVAPGEAIGFSTENLPAGTYTIGVQGNLLQVDQSVKIFAVTYQVTIVDSQEELPTGAPEIGSYSQTITINASK